MNRRDGLLALVPPLCFGTGFTIAKPALEQFPPLMMMALVYGGIVLVLAFTARDPIKTPWRALFWISLFALPLQGVLLFLGLKSLDATTATLVLQIQVPFAVLLGWLFADEKIDAAKIIGMVIAIAGVVLVIGLPGQRPPLAPVLMVAVSALIWAFGQVLARKLGRDDGILQLKGLSLAGLPQLVLASALFETGHLAAITTADRWDWLALAFVGTVGFYLAYAIWYSLLRRCRVDEVAPFILLMPVFGVITAALVLGERIEAAHLIGGAVILAGLAIVSGLVPKRAGVKT
jgi:O-acetylserine/cysteine efflux transporter